MANELIQIQMTEAQKAGLLRRAALLTAKAGKRVTMSDLVRASIDAILETSIDEYTSKGKGRSIKFTPLPPVEKALQRAHANSGKPVGEIVNELLVEALEVAV